MSAPKKNGGFTVKEITVSEKGVTYATFQLCGYLNGERIRKRFKSRAHALGEKNALEVEAANAGGEIRALNTRLSPEQLAETEAAFARLGPRSLSLAVEWFLSTYRPPVAETTIAAAAAAFFEDRKAHVREITLRDYRLTLKSFQAALPEIRARTGQVATDKVHQVTTADVLAFITGRNVGKKRWSAQRQNHFRRNDNYTSLFS